MSDAYQLAINAMQDNLPRDISLLRRAIHDNDEEAVRAIGGSLHKELTIIPKRCAIESNNPRLLRILLNHDKFMDESLMESACKEKNHEIIDTLLAYGWDINEPLNPAGFPLWFSVDDMPFMKWLISKGANIKARSMLDTSTLSKAILDGSMEVVQFLLAQEEDVNRGDLLHCAAERENQDEGAMLVKELVKRGANIDTHRYLHDDAIKYRYQSKLGTPLHTACYEMNFPVAKALLDHGANLHCKMLLESEEIDPTPLEMAVGTGDPRWIGLFEAKDLLDVRV